MVREARCSGRVLSRRAWLGVLAAAVACSSGPSDPVQQLLEELEAAAEARDADGFGARLAEDFKGARGMGRADALATLRRYLAAYESVGLEVYGVEIDRDGPTAKVRCVIEFSGRARPLGGLQGLLPPDAAYRFDLGVAEEEDGWWRVRQAAWEQIPPDAVS